MKIINYKKSDYYDSAMAYLNEPDKAIMDGAKASGTDRVELYTEMYASGYQANREEAVAPYVASSEHAQSLGLELNAGHDLDLVNLQFLKQSIPYIKEVSIGHALVCDALYFGLENVIPMYKRLLD